MSEKIIRGIFSTIFLLAVGLQGCESKKSGAPEAGVEGEKVELSAPVTCSNGVKDEGETDVDCGGNTGCPKCGPFRTCSQDSDCLPEYTNEQGQSYAGIICTDSVEVNGQTFTFQSKGCNSDQLYGDAQRLADNFVNTINQGGPGGGHCANGIQDSNETGVDCGGTCSPCGLGGSTGSGGTGSGGTGTGGTGTGGTGAGGTGTGGTGTGGTGTGGTGTGGTGTGGTGTGTTGVTTGDPVQDCQNNIKDNAETDVDCGGGTCDDCGPGKLCNTNQDCQSTGTVNGTTYSDFVCFGNPPQAACASSSQMVAFVAALPKRFTPSGCHTYQYTFVSDKDGADNVYAVPCNDDGFYFRAVKLTQNTDPTFHYDSIAIKPDATQVLYGTFGDNMGWSLYFDSGPVIGQASSTLGLESAYGSILPTWESNGQEFGFVRFDLSRKYEMALSNFSNLQNPWRLSSSGREIKGFVFSPTLADSNSPGYGKYIVSEKGTDGIFYLYVWKSGESARYVESYRRHGDFFEWDKVTGTNPAISPDGTKLAYVNGNYIYYCPFNFTPVVGPAEAVPTGETIYKCNDGSLVGGASQVPASSPCWSANGKYIYYQLNYLSVNFIARYDVDTQTTVVLDEFTQSPAGKGERNPGCYPK